MSASISLSVRLTIGMQIMRVPALQAVRLCPGPFEP